MVGALVRRAVCAVAVMCAVVGAARAWGDTGHQLTAQVATAFLTSEAKSEANTILQGQTLQDVVTWADSVRTKPGFEWSGVLHYVNTPSWACTYDSGDCPDNMCVVGAIQNYSTRLQKEAAGGEQQLEAFKFLIHFCGDIHQPLHVAFAADRGGNDIYGEFLGQHGSLHGDWDYNIISNRITNDFSGSQDDYGNYLIQQIQSGDYANNNWTQCDSGRSNSGSNSWLCPAEWASITANLACNYAYVDEYGNRIEQNFDLDEGYQTNTQGIVDMQLAKSGVRMAFALNKILGAMHADRMARQGGHDAAHHHRHHGK